MELILYFFLYSFFGWLCECIYCSIPAHTFINRGFLAGPYCPIYGCGALAVLHILDPFGFSIPLMFVMGIVVTSALEYVTSWGMEVLFHTKWWDYSSYPFNIHGRVCLKNSLLFGCMVLVVYYLIHPAIQEFVHLFSPGMQTMLCTAALFGFGYDLFNTALALQENLSDAVARVLDSTNADEILLERIERLRQRITSLHTKRKRTHIRLQKAFPTRIEAISRINAERLFSIINERRKKEDGK